MKRQILAIIPARWGSERISNKNIKEFSGKPLMVWTIEAALGSKKIDRVVVSSDSDKILKIAEKHGAEPIKRPKELAHGKSITEECMLHVLEVLGKEGYNPSAVILLQPTSPLRNSRHIDEAIECFEKNGNDSLLSVSENRKFIWKRDGSPMNYDPMNRPMSQDKAWELAENGAIYITKTNVLKKYRNRLGGKIGFYVMGNEESIEIDNHFEFYLAEKTLEYMKMKNRPSFGKIKTLFVDFDGVMTDNSFRLDTNKTETVTCNRSDGLGIKRLKQAGVNVFVISGEENPIVTVRCNKLGIVCA
ncbi:MAG: hypothetical protein DRP08_05440, partial [Candidatus Aenigmatarchaeota archaeon]